jgi:hypothetical protein
VGRGEIKVVSQMGVAIPDVEIERRKTVNNSNGSLGGQCQWFLVLSWIHLGNATALKFFVIQRQFM